MCDLLHLLAAIVKKNLNTCIYLNTVVCLTFVGINFCWSSTMNNFKDTCVHGGNDYLSKFKLYLLLQWTFDFVNHLNEIQKMDVWQISKKKTHPESVHVFCSVNVVKIGYLMLYSIAIYFLSDMYTMYKVHCLWIWH